MLYTSKTNKKIVAVALVAFMFSNACGEINSSADTANHMEIVTESEIITDYISSGNIDASNVANRRTGFYRMGDKWTFYEDGVQKRGWITYKGIKYYILSDYTLPQSMWKKIDGNMYYFNRDGIMVKNQKARLGGVVYQFDENGHSVKPTGKIDFTVPESQERLYNLGDDILDAAYERPKSGEFYESGEWKTYKNNRVISEKNSLKSRATDSKATSREDIKSKDKTEYVNSEKIKKVIDTAESKIGSPYKWGASGPNSFDCSGLMVYSFSKAGINLPRTSSKQAKEGSYVSRSDLKPGDLIFWGEPAHHVGIYVGNGEYVHAPYPGASVEKQSLGSYTTARRISE